MNIAHCLLPVVIAIVFWSALTPLADGQETPAAYQPTIRCVNLDANSVPELAAAAAKLHVQLAPADAITAAEQAAVVVWEAKESAEIDADQATRLGDYVRNGGNLILTLDKTPGKGPFRLGFMLPTMAWRSLMGIYRGPELVRSAKGGQWDPAMFPQAPDNPPNIPYFYALRPFDTVERGQHRYEQIDRQMLFLGGVLKPWDPSYTRPLLNRAWQIRVRADDLGGSGLLLTGRYGAGSVAVFASAARFMGEGIWTPLLTWMQQNQAALPAAPVAPTNVTMAIAVDVVQRTLNVDLTNHDAAAVKVELVARMLTWQNALIGDVNRPMAIPANGLAAVAIPIPPVDANSYQELAFRDAYIVRLGVLGPDARQLLGQQRTSVDLRPATRVAVMLDNLRAIPYPFKAPGYDGLSTFPSRMGEPVMAYAYPPGAAVSGVVRLSNGLTNIAPLAKVADETQPENPSLAAVNDEIVVAGKTPRGDLLGYGWWTGQADKENSLQFTFPGNVMVNEVVLNGNPDGNARLNLRNPGAVIVETDAGEAAHLDGLDEAFQTGLGLVHIRFPATRTQHLRVRFPWIAKVDAKQKRGAPALGQIQVIGCAGDLPPAVHGKLSVSLVDALHQTTTALDQQPVQLESGQELEIPIHFAATGEAAGEPSYYRVEASFTPDGTGAATADVAPFMVIQPEHPLQPLSAIRPPGHVEIGFIVTRGFRNCFDIGTGTQESTGAWSTPDDLVWAFARQLKQTATGMEKAAAVHQLYVTDANFKHYAAPWSVFPNGEVFFTLAAPNLLARAKANANWKNSDTVALFFSDRWDTGPSGNNLYSWQELVAFDQYLADQGLPRLAGKTRQELIGEIRQRYGHRWSAWQMARYAASVTSLRDTFAKEGKRLVISAQGLPLVPLKYLADLAQTIAGMSDDSTWGMWQENIPVTTGRQMTALAFNPDWRLAEPLVPGYDSGIFNGPFWGPVGTTESTRRHFFDPGWRGLIASDGHYRSMHTYGFQMNGGASYVMNRNDWQENWRLSERLSLLSPDGPVGAGVIFSNASWDDPDHATFSGGGMGGSEGDDKIRDGARAIGAWAEAGIPIAFSSNVTALGKWPGQAPLILLGLTELSDREIEILTGLNARGVPMAAMSGDGPIPAAAAKLFGVAGDGTPTTGKVVGTYQGTPVVATEHTLLIHGSFANPDAADLRKLLEPINRTLALSLKLPAGMTGYGFTMGKQKYLVLEDWREEGRTVTVRLQAGEHAQRLLAVNVDDHLPLKVQRDGPDWLIQFPTRPGDGTLLCVQE